MFTKAARPAENAEAQSPPTPPFAQRQSPKSTAVWRGLRPSDGRRPPCRDTVPLWLEQLLESIGVNYLALAMPRSRWLLAVTAAVTVAAL